MASPYWDVCQQLTFLPQASSLVDEYSPAPQQATSLDNAQQCLTNLKIEETQTTLVITAQLADVDVESLDIRVTPELLFLSGEHLEQGEVPGYCKFSYPNEKFRSLIALSHPVQPDSAIADIQGDRLTLTLQKEEPQDRRSQRQWIRLQECSC